MGSTYKPDGFHSVTPYLFVKDAAKLIEFMVAAFGATEKDRVSNNDGTVAHSEVKLGDTMIEISEARDKWPALPCALHFYVEDADAVYARALEVGGTSIYEPTDQFYGDREAGITDPCGNMWFISTHKETVAADEMERRTQEWVEGQEK